MNCLCCGKPLESGDMEGGWHKKCVRSFFGSTVLPELEIDEETLARIAAESCSKGFTVPGVQKNCPYT